jgi:hypothetical protein
VGSEGGGPHVVEAHPDLAVGVLPQRAAPLASHAHGGGPLFGEARVIEGKAARGGGEPSGKDLDEAGLEQIGIPRGVSEDVLDPIDGGFRNPLGNGLH